MVASLTTDPGIASCIPAWSELYPCLVPYFRWIDCEMISMVILLLPADSRRVVGSYTKYWLTALDTLAQEKVWLGELTVPPWPWLLTET